MDLHPPTIVHVPSDDLLDEPHQIPTSPLSTAPNSPRVSPDRSSTTSPPPLVLPSYDLKRQNSELGRESRLCRLRAQAKQLLSQKSEYKNIDETEQTSTSEDEDELLLPVVKQQTIVPASVVSTKDSPAPKQKTKTPSRLERFVAFNQTEAPTTMDELQSTANSSHKIQLEMKRRRQVQNNLKSRIQSKLGSSSTHATTTPFDERRGEGSEDDERKVMAATTTTASRETTTAAIASVYSPDRFFEADAKTTATDELVPADEAWLDETVPDDERQNPVSRPLSPLEPQIEVVHENDVEIVFHTSEPQSEDVEVVLPTTVKAPKPLSATQELLAKLKRARKRSDSQTPPSKTESASTLSPTAERSTSEKSLPDPSDEASPTHESPSSIDSKPKKKQSSPTSTLATKTSSTPKKQRSVSSPSASVKHATKHVAPSAKESIPSSNVDGKSKAERSRSPKRSKASPSNSRKSPRGNASPPRSPARRRSTSPPKQSRVVEKPLSPERVVELENEILEPRPAAETTHAANNVALAHYHEALPKKQAVSPRNGRDLSSSPRASSGVPDEKKSTDSVPNDTNQSATASYGAPSLLSDSSWSSEDVLGPLKNDHRDPSKPGRFAQDDYSSSDETLRMSNGFFKGRRHRSRSRRSLDKRSEVLPYGGKEYQDYWKAKANKVRVQKSQLRDLYGKAKQAKTTTGGAVEEASKEQESAAKEESESLLALPPLVVDQEQLKSIGVKALTTVCNGIGSLFLHPDSASKATKQDVSEPKKKKVKAMPPRLKSPRSKSPVGRIRLNRRRRQAAAVKIDDQEENLFAPALERSLEAQKPAEKNEAVVDSESKNASESPTRSAAKIQQEDDSFSKDVENDQPKPELDDTSTSSVSVPPLPPSVPQNTPVAPSWSIDRSTPTISAPFDEAEEIVIEDRAEWSLVRAIQERSKKTTDSPKEPDGSRAESILVDQRVSRDPEEGLDSKHRPIDSPPEVLDEGTAHTDDKLDLDVADALVGHDTEKLYDITESSESQQIEDEAEHVVHGVIPPAKNDPSKALSSEYSDTEDKNNRSGDAIEKPPSIRRVNVGLDLDDSFGQVQSEENVRTDTTQNKQSPDVALSPMSEFLAARVQVSSGPVLLASDSESVHSDNMSTCSSSTDELLSSLHDLVKDLDGLATARRAEQEKVSLSGSLQAPSVSEVLDEEGSAENLPSALEPCSESLLQAPSFSEGLDEEVSAGTPPRTPETCTLEIASLSGSLQAPSFSEVLDKESSAESPLGAPKTCSLDDPSIENDMPFLVSLIDNDIGIPKGDAMISLLNYEGNATSSWTQRVDDAIWRCRVMRRHSDVHWLERKNENEQRLTKASLDDVRVIGGISDMPSTEMAAVDHLNFDNLGDALTLYEDMCLTYEAQANRIKRKKDTAMFDSFKPFVAVALHNLGLVHLLRGEHEEAFAFFSHASEIRADCLGVGHRDHITSMVKAAICRVALDDYSTAYSELEEAVLHAREETSTLPDYRQLAEILNNLGCLAYMGGKLERSMMYFRESEKVQDVISEQSAYIGSRFSCLSMTLNMSVTKANIGFLLLLSRDLVGSVQLFESAMKSQELLLRDAHITLISTMEHLVVANLLSGRKMLALQLLRRISNMQMDAFGPNDEKCVATEKKIALLVSNEIQADDSSVCSVCSSVALPIASESEIWESAKHISPAGFPKEQNSSDGQDVLISI